ncbi:NADH-quinone oxidoreductase subunit L [Gluconacetobacter sp. 1c LMG 22058]|uniref:NADH-quinone oxidoreductase subunit L n=1 Tax=Gluconacetobacter dulcium TaxID=2729096 RepID=A0A7W4K048_9PROT|nr:NADH-quinone oxidoreductase subunit L [Gluconacetobacter dulcium]MBB2197945.1 NADH-quinone oxidoreductase subunit L [Gluconacetobacter dulcium]
MDALLLPLIVACPLLAAGVLFLSAGRMPPLPSCVIGAGSVGLSALMAAVLAIGFLRTPPPTGALHATLWSWMQVEGFSARIAFMLDPLSLVMMLVVTGVGFLILLYACGYMHDDPDIARFFGCMTLFVAAMLVLVFSSDLLSLYIGWEGVGICSYLLIGFWHTDTANVTAARKAFIVTRIGDAAMLCGLLLLATRAGTLDVASVLQTVTARPADLQAATAAFLLLGGAVAKSAQVPLQTWLPDAMAGPTPVSALIHAATMVTAGVYLIARLHPLFASIPVAMTAVALIGLITLLLAAGSALVQTDIKRILAYSTMSQIGYMFLALGTGAWQAAIFHLVTHAFFKALLFMAAGAIILRVHHRQDIYRMGGLAPAMPGVFAAFLAGSAALAGLPLLTAGFYSKEMILQGAWHADPMLWAGALLGAFATAIYIFRCVFIVFFGPRHTEPHGRTGATMAIPLVCLAVLALTGGWMEMPDAIAPVHLLSNLLSPLFGAPMPEGPHWLLWAGSLVPLAGIGVAWMLWQPRTGTRTPPENALARLARAGWDFDTLYDVLIVRPFTTLGRLNQTDICDRLSDATAATARAGGRMLGRMQSGQVRRYAGWIAAGTVVALCLGVRP